MYACNYFKNGYVLNMDVCMFEKYKVQLFFVWMCISEIILYNLG